MSGASASTEQTIRLAGADASATSSVGTGAGAVASAHAGATVVPLLVPEMVLLVELVPVAELVPVSVPDPPVDQPDPLTWSVPNPQLDQTELLPLSVLEQLPVLNPLLMVVLMCETTAIVSGML